MSVCRTVYEIFSVEEWRDLKTGCRGRSRSLKMAPFDRPYTTFYWSANVCCTIFKSFDVNNHDIQKVPEGHSTGAIRKLGCGFLFAFHSNYGSILHQFRDKARYWSNIVIFSYPLAFDAPVGILTFRLVSEN